MDAQRDIGRLGTLARTIGGLTLLTVPVAGQQISWWDIGGSLVAFPLLAVGVVALLRPNRAPPAGRLLTGAHAASAIAIVLVVQIGVTFISPIDEPAIWIFVGISMLLAALRGYGGCELLAIPNALTARRDHLRCFIFTPIDAAEARSTQRPATPS